MDRIKLNYFVDLGLAVSFVITAVTGILKFPAFGGRARDFMLLHDWAGIALAAFVLLHLILHWNWMVCMTKGFFKKKK
ncbi:MAG: DUF4405 domain-containing protein [Candidatus Woesearchaeota archaeon]